MSISSTLSTLLILKHFFNYCISYHLVIFARVFLYVIKGIFDYSDETGIYTLVTLNNIIDNYYLRKSYVSNMYIVNLANLNFPIPNFSSKTHMTSNYIALRYLFYFD